MYILKNRVLSLKGPLLITIMLLVSGNMSLFGVSDTENKLNVSQKEENPEVQNEKGATNNEDEPIEGDLFLSGSIMRLGNLIGPGFGGLTRVGSETIVSKEKMDPNTLVISVWATSRDHPGENEPRFNGWLTTTAKKHAYSEQFPPEWQKLSNKEFIEKWDSLTKKEQNDLCPLMSKEEEHKYWRQNRNEALKSGRSDNWSNSSTTTSFLSGSFPLYFPIKYFNGRKEKDILPIEICDDTRKNCKNVNLRLRQKIYRYGDIASNKKMPIEKMFNLEKVLYVRYQREELDNKLIKLGISDTEEGKKQRESLNNKLIDLGVLDEEEGKK